MASLSDYDKNVTSRIGTALQENPTRPDFSENSISILEKRYFAKAEDGTPIEDTGMLLRRVAANVAYPDAHYTGDEGKAIEIATKFYEIMARREFMPNSPTLMNAGGELQQLSACFVLPVGDSMKAIFGQVYNAAMVHKSGGGTGFSFSRVRRKGEPVSQTNGRASGPLSFIGAFDAATDSVKQGGTRRGANMGMLNVDHPDVLEFIYAKQNEASGKYGNFNFSICITDDFMEAVKNGDHYVLKKPIGGETYDFTLEDIARDDNSEQRGLILSSERLLVVRDDGTVIYQNPTERDIRGRVVEVEEMEVGKVDDQERITLDARKVFDIIASLAWKNGEPGVAFIDRINAHNPTPGVGRMEATNPCGEQPLLPYEACNLGSINLGLMVEDGEINYEKLEDLVDTATHFLDNVVDMSKFPLDEITEMVHSNRKIGLGVMGWADMLSKLRVPYDSEEAIGLAKKVMGFIHSRATAKSEQLGQERCSFPNFDKSIYVEGPERRNATVTTIAPTGTISIIAGASSGIEPLFGLYYTHKDADGIMREFTNPILEEALREAGIAPEKVLEELSQGKSLQELEFIPEEIRKAFPVSTEISPDYHIRMQAAFQEVIDNAVSKTVLMPKDATVEEVKQIYQAAFDTGCKGITVYRMGSRQEEVLQTKTLEKTIEFAETKERPTITQGMGTELRRTGCGSLFVTANYTEDETGFQALFEAFATMGKAGGCASCQGEGIGRLVSYALRMGINPNDVANELIGVNCHKPYNVSETEEESIELSGNRSCADAIGKVLMRTAEKIEQTNIERGLEASISYITPTKRPEELEGTTIKRATGCGNLFVTANYTEEAGNKRLLEVFATMGKGGGCASCQTEALGRLSSLILRANGNPLDIASELMSINCNKPYGLGEKGSSSCADAIGKVIARKAIDYGVTAQGIGLRNVDDSEEEVQDIRTLFEEQRVSGGCPKCGSPLSHGEGCMGGICSNPTCGHSECS